MTHVILLNLGGPGSTDEVKPFLLNLFTDPDIIDLPGGKITRNLVARIIVFFRTGKVKEIYNLIGGKSPLLELTKNQASQLEKELSPDLKCKVHLAMRYTAPFTVDALKDIREEDELIYLPLYPQFSKTTTCSSFNEIERVKKKLGKTFKKELYIDEYHDFPPYINAWVSNIQRTINGIPKEKLAGTTLLFSAHGVPQSVIDKGDPYEKHIRENVDLIVKGLKWDNPWDISFQSKASPAPWLEPSTGDKLKSLAGEGVKSVIVVPIAFVSEHSETLYELDILLKDEAVAAGIENYYRVPAFNDDPEFITALKEVVLKHVANEKQR